MKTAIFFFVIAAIWLAFSVFLCVHFNINHVMALSFFGAGVVFGAVLFAGISTIPSSTK